MQTYLCLCLNKKAQLVHFLPRDYTMSIILTYSISCNPRLVLMVFFEDAKQQLVSEQLKNQRLMEAFQKKSRELREVNYKVLGYRVDMPDSDEFRLMSMYAETPNDFFIFKVTRLFS